MNEEKNEKVKIPLRVADAIEYIWTEQTHKHSVCKHLYLNNWELLRTEVGDQLVDMLTKYVKNNPIKYMDALVNGYEIEETQYIVDVELKDGTYLPKCTVFPEDTDQPITNKGDIEHAFTLLPWGNEHKKFRLQSKHVQAFINPSLVKKYSLLKVDE